MFIADINFRTLSSVQVYFVVKALDNLLLKLKLGVKCLKCLDLFYLLAIEDWNYLNIEITLDFYLETKNKATNIITTQ